MGASRAGLVLSRLCFPSRYALRLDIFACIAFNACVGALVRLVCRSSVVARLWGIVRGAVRGLALACALLPWGVASCYGVRALIFAVVALWCVWACSR